MNKKLLTQIKNEWRSNLWLVTELLLVSVVMWYIVDYMYVKAAVYYEPRGWSFSEFHWYSLYAIAGAAFAAAAYTTIRKLSQVGLSQ